MCDTVVALADSTSERVTLFGKNSDRPPNEAQVIRYEPAKRNDISLPLKCTYVAIPQVRSTFSVVLSSPQWLWGAEMGANERGVAIGNEAVFSNEEVPETGLLGMDLVRLGLERGKNAREALGVITALLEKHGQGGICELGGVLTYHNSFLIADPKEAWVLETSQRRWVAEKVRNVRSISNGYTIHDRWDLGSPDVVEHAIKQGWCKDDSGFDFAAVYGNETVRYVTHCDDRRSCTSSTLQSKTGRVSFSDMVDLLRSHPQAWTPWNQEQAPVCQHAGPMSGSLTAGSQVSKLSNNALHWFTGSSHPCMSVYVPFTFNAPYVYRGMDAAGVTASNHSFWWNRERASRAIAMRFSALEPSYGLLVQKAQEKIDKIAHANLNTEAIEDALREFTGSMAQLAAAKPVQQDIPSDYVEFWKENDQKAGLH